MADNNDFMRDASVDKILEDVRKLTGNKSEKETKIWSLDEIDALLSDDGGNDTEKSGDYDRFELNTYYETETSESPEVPVQKFSLDPDFEKTLEEEYPDEEEEKFELTGYSEEEDQTETAEDFDEDIKELISEYAPEKVETVSISEETSSGLGLKEFARSRGVINNSKEETSAEKTEEALPAEDVTAEAQQEDVPDEIEPLIEGAEIPDEPEPQEEPEEKTAEYIVPGQISIEKTRLFNEVEARAIRNENIEHHIGNKIINTGEIPQGTKMETDPYRERFLNKPVLNIEKTQEHKDLVSKLPPKTIEKHGVVVKKPDLDRTSEDGLSPVPILIDAAEEYDAQKKLEVDTQTGTLKSNAMKNLIEQERLDNQIVLDGFDEEEEINEVSEEEAEAELSKVRKDRASKFRLFPNLETSEDEEMEDIVSDSGELEEADEEEPEIAEEAEESIEEEELKQRKKRLFSKDVAYEAVRVEREFFGPKDANAVYEIFQKQSRTSKLKIVISAISIVLLIVSSIAVSTFGNFTVFADSPPVYIAISLLLLIIVGVTNYKSVLSAFENLSKKRLNSDTAIALSLIMGAIQCLVAFGFTNLVASGTHIYAGVAVLPVLLVNIGEYIKIRNDIDNFILLNEKQGSFYALKQVEDEGIAFEIGRSMMIKDPDVRYSAKVNFPYKFVEMSRKLEASADVFRLALPVALIASVVVGIITAIINKNVFSGITSMSGVLFMGIPSAAGLASSFILKKTNKTLKEDNSIISGYEAVEDATSSNAVVFDAADLFENGNSTIYGIKLYNSMRIDEAILYTASVVIHSDGPLKEVFDGIILSNKEMLPPVESLAYEDRLGCSGWIYNYRVLVGNRDLLIKHNVEVQSKEAESTFTKSGRQVMYLAVEGKVAAMFVIGYKPDSQTAGYLRKLEKSGVGILIRTSDANITEELIEQYFDLPSNYVKVISPVAGVMYKQLHEKVESVEPCRVLHNGKINSMLRSFVAVFSVSEQYKISTILQYIGIGLGILIMSMLSFVSGLSQAGALQIILFELIWSAIVIFIPRLKKI